MCVSGGLWRLHVYSCRRVLWRAHPSSRTLIFLDIFPRGATAGVCFLLEATLSQPLAYCARTDHLGSRLHFRYATVCVKHSGAQLLGVDFGRRIGLCRLLVLRTAHRSRCSLCLTGDRNRLRVVFSRGVVYPRYLPRTELPAW